MSPVTKKNMLVENVLYQFHDIFVKKNKFIFIIFSKFREIRIFDISISRNFCDESVHFSGQTVCTTTVQNNGSVMMGTIGCWQFHEFFQKNL